MSLARRLPRLRSAAATDDVSGRGEGMASGLGACRVAKVGGIAGAGWRGRAS